MSTFEIKFNGQITKLRASNANLAATRVAYDNRVPFGEFKQTAEIRLVVRGRQASWGRVW